MFHVFRVLPPGFSWKCSKSQSLNKGEAPNFSKSQSFYKEGRLGIFPSPRGYITDQSLYREEARNFSKSRSLSREGKLEYFQVPEPIQQGVFLRTFHIFLHIPSYFLHIPSYCFIFYTYFFISLHTRIFFISLHTRIFFIFLRIPSYFPQISSDFPKSHR